VEHEALAVLAAQGVGIGLTADYAFGHDLLKVAKVFMQGQGGTFAADELVPSTRRIA
jgi:hypothetical protein